MNAEIVAVGTEMTTGATLDTNSQWLSVELASAGIPVKYHVTVADDLDAIVGVLAAAVDRAEVVVVTGGLGPTLDDLTRQAIAGLLGVELAVDPASLAFIESLFARHNREMPERNRIQAYFPVGASPIPNLRGTAPGIWVTIPRAGRADCVLVALPGVPSEMKRMFQLEVAPRLGGGSTVIQRARVHCFGVGESKAEEMLGELTARGRDPEIGITVHQATITLRIVAHAESVEACQAKVSAAKAAIGECMGDMLFGEEEEELQHVVVRLLLERSETLATTEVGTGGLLATRITEVAGCERCYRGGSIAIAGEAAGEAAERCRRQFEADYALAVGSLPAYNPDDVHATAPKMEVALASPAGVRVIELTLLGDLAINKARAVKTALNALRLHLQRIRSKGPST